VGLEADCRNSPVRLDRRADDDDGASRSTLARLADDVDNAPSRDRGVSLDAVSLLCESDGIDVDILTPTPTLAIAPPLPLSAPP
jgi:hypothetical protein